MAKFLLETQTTSELDRLVHEQSLWLQGIRLLAGVDEVGRGCLFGPVVAAAVVMPEGLRMPAVRDSKQLSAKTREILYDEILAVSIASSVSVVSVAEIEQLNIKHASRLAMKEAVLGLYSVLTPDWLLIDAEQIDLPLPQTSLIKGDDLSQSIAAASILAKVTRDRMASDWDTLYPGYGLAQNKGYASREHFAALDRLGPTPEHRPTFLRKWASRLQEGSTWTSLS
ncbi:MAG: ribonuclease [Bacilli bacterium]|nr:ribonuclease [Bacilli bacterium]